LLTGSGSDGGRRNASCDTAGGADGAAGAAGGGEGAASATGAVACGAAGADVAGAGAAADGVVAGAFSDAALQAVNTNTKVTIIIVNKTRFFIKTSSLFLRF